MSEDLIPEVVTPTRQRWFKMADWCKEHGLSPFDLEDWKAAGRAVDAQENAEIDNVSKTNPLSQEGAK